MDEGESIRLTDRALELGINFIDTANIYNCGLSETITGRAIKGRRHNLILATKVRGRMGEEADEEGLSRPAIRRAIQESLKRLQTDYVDLYYLHQPDWNVPLEETLAAMDELVQEGKVRYPAVSNYAAWQVVQMLWISENHGYLSPTVSQPMYNILARGIEQEYLACCLQYGVANVVYNPLAGGLLTGKHLPASPPAAGTRFDGNKMYLDRYWHPQYFEALAELKGVAADAGIDLKQLAFQWLWSRPAVDSIILGATRIEHLEENLKACAGTGLSADTLARCDQVWDKLRGVAPKYNR